jgi:N-acetylglucosaminyldiphosphoundecaprenol N-acetyl-beta-D-mannosaminyltransferase
MRDALAEAAMVLPDGVGIILAARILGHQHHGRVAGPDFMPYLCDIGRSAGLRHFFYGGAEGVPEKLAAVLSESYPGLQVCGTCSPPFRSLTPQEDQEIVERIKTTHPDILWVGLGAPKQEKWMLEHHGKIGATMLGVGAAFDFQTGRVKRASTILRTCRIEWAGRLARQPCRMWRRNLDSPLFLWRVLRQRRGTNKHMPRRPESQADPTAGEGDRIET